MARGLNAACIAAAGVLLMVSLGNGVAADGGSYEDGDTWVYDVEILYESFEFSGSMTHVVVGDEVTESAGLDYEVYNISVDGKLWITGEYEGVDIVGTYTYNGSAYLEMDDLDLVRSEERIVTAMTFEYASVPTYFEYVEETTTTYSTPGGVGDEPEDPTDGDSWELAFTYKTESMYDDNGEISYDSDISVEQVGFTYLRKETITVPAGTYECDVIHAFNGETRETYWTCDEAGGDVKYMYESVSGENGTYLLRSTTFAPTSTLGIALIYVSIGAVAAAAAVVAFLLVRRSKGAKSQLDQAPTEIPPIEIPPQSLPPQDQAPRPPPSQ